MKDLRTLMEVYAVYDKKGRVLPYTIADSEAQAKERFLERKSGAFGFGYYMLWGYSVELVNISSERIERTTSIDAHQLAYQMNCETLNKVIK